MILQVRSSTTQRGWCCFSLIHVLYRDFLAHTDSSYNRTQSPLQCVFATDIRRNGSGHAAAAVSSRTMAKALLATEAP